MAIHFFWLMILEYPYEKSLIFIVQATVAQVMCVGDKFHAFECRRWILCSHSHILTLC